MKKTKEQKGITLISLVITIILLLILATVAINLAVDSDGLFRKAGQAANSWNESVAVEQSTLQNLLDVADNVGPKGPVSEYITETSEVAGVEKERTVPIPAGYVASKATGENTIEGGLVIYQTNTEVNDTNHDDAVEDYNQYVWIPVDDINDMVMCSVCGGSVENLEYDDATKTLACTSTHAEGTTPTLAGKLYAEYGEGSGETQDAEGNTVLKAVIDFTRNSEDRGINEPASVTGDEDTLLAEMQNDFNNMAKSVAKYGGFYISRYEIGENAESKKGQTVLSYSLPTNWYTLQSTSRKTGASTTSQMLWSSQYDQVIKFIGEEAMEGHVDRNIDEDLRETMSGEGMTEEIMLEVLKEIFEAGNNTLDQMKNIYDLEGNFYEWTAGSWNSDERMVRGGHLIMTSDGLYVGACYYPNRFIAEMLESLPAGALGPISLYSTRSALFVNL